MKITKSVLRKIIREEYRNSWNDRNLPSSHRSRAAEFGADYDAPRGRRSKKTCPTCGGSRYDGEGLYPDLCKTCDGLGFIAESSLTEMPIDGQKSYYDNGGPMKLTPEEQDRVGEEGRCESCGLPGTYMVDPYEQKINGDEALVCFCDRCVKNR